MKQAITILSLILVGLGNFNFIQDKEDFHECLLNLKDNDSAYFTITRLSEQTNIGEADVFHINRQGNLYEVHCDTTIFKQGHGSQTKIFTSTQYKNFISKIELKSHGLYTDRYEFYCGNQLNPLRVSTLPYYRDSLLNFFARQPN